MIEWKRERGGVSFFSFSILSFSSAKKKKLYSALVVFLLLFSADALLLFLSPSTPIHIILWSQSFTKKKENKKVLNRKEKVLRKKQQEQTQNTQLGAVASQSLALALGSSDLRAA